MVAEIGLLKRYYPAGTLVRKTNQGFTWEMDLQPTFLSRIYRIRIIYTIGMVTRIFVIEPKILEKYPGNSKLEHVYSTKKQQLCLYFPKSTEWNSTMFVARTLVPWASDWLFYYELWLSTGQWLGGGIHANEKHE